MNMPVSHVELSPTARSWLDLASTSSEATIFHHPAWSGLLAACYGFRPFVMAVCDASGTVLAALPMAQTGGGGRPGRRWVSLPFTDHCPPLHRGEQFKEQLADTFMELSCASRGPSIELRCDLLGDRPGVVTQAGHVLHTVPLSEDVDAVLSRVSSMHRRNTRTAQKKGVVIERGTGPDHVEAFYRLHLQTRRRQGVPVQPRRFFELLGSDLLEKDLGFVSLAYRDGRCLAAAVFLHWGDTLMYKYGASSIDDLNLRPNNLLFWEAIRWGCQHGYGRLDLGRTDTSNTGLRAFKSGWGADEVALGYSSFPPAQPNALLGKAVRAGGAVIRHAPPWVCRATGELLYKHFG